MNYKKHIKTIAITALIICLIGAFFLIWENYVIQNNIPKRILPKPSDISTYLYNEFFTSHRVGYEGLLVKAWQSFSDALLGFFISIILGSLLGIALAHNETFSIMLKPFVFITQLLPVPAFAPVIATVLGYDSQTKILIIVIFTIFPVIITVEKTINNIPKNLISLFRLYNAKRIEVLQKLIFPSLIPCLLTNAKILCTASFVTSIIAELPLTVSQGIGKDIFNSFNNQVNVRVWASLVIIAVISLVFFMLVSAFEKYILSKWGFENNES